MIRKLQAQTVDAVDAVLSVVAASPGHKISGKKRIQKTLYLCLFSGASIDANFHIRQFGVFSPEVSDALESLAAFGQLSTHDEQVGRNGYFTTVFGIKGKPKHSPDPLIAGGCELLSKYATTTLEVASTIGYFVKDGCSEAEAIKRTKALKPVISTSEQIQLSKTILGGLAELCSANHGQRPTGT